MFKEIIRFLRTAETQKQILETELNNNNIHYAYKVNFFIILYTYSHPRTISATMLNGTQN